MINANGHIIARGGTYTLLNKLPVVYTLSAIHLGSAMVKAQGRPAIWVDVNDLVKHRRILNHTSCKK